MKHIVSIEATGLSATTERLKVLVDGVIRGVVDIQKKESPVMPALLLLGFDAVHCVDEAGNDTRYTIVDFLRGQPATFGGSPAGTGGIVTLTDRWSEPLEEYRTAVKHNEVQLKSVDSRMNYRTLRSILVELGFTVGHIQELAQAA